VAPVGDEYTVTLPVVMISRVVAEIVVVTTVTGCVVTVVATGVAVVAVVAAVVAGVAAVVALGVATVVAVGATVVGDVAMVVVIVVAGIVTLAALTGRTTRSIARNTAAGMRDDPFPRDIDKILPAGFAGDFL